MAITYHFPTNVECVNIAPAGHVHERAPEASRLTVTCDACAPYLYSAGGRERPDDCELTREEREAAEQATRDGQALTNALGRAMVEAARDHTTGALLSGRVN